VTNPLDLLDSQLAGKAAGAKPASPLDRLNAQVAAPSQPQPAPPGALSEMGRALGLTGRAAVTGVTGLPAMLGDALNSAINLGVDGVNSVAGTSIPRLGMPSQVIQRAEDKVFPVPRDGNERMVQDVAAAGFGLGPTNAAGKVLANATSPAVRAAGKVLTAVPGNQLVAATTGAAAAGGAREAGLGPGWQLGAGIAGGIAGSLGGAAAGSAAAKVRNTVSPSPGNPHLAPAAVESVLGESPLPPSPAVQQELQNSTASILASTPGADAASAARAADAKRLGMSLTLGQVTRDPALFAREQNWRGLEVGAPLLQKFNTQNSQLAKVLSGAVGDAQEPYHGGKQIIDTLASIDDSMSKQVSAAYKAAEQSSGAKLNVPLKGLAQDYAEVLHNFGDKVPTGVRNNFDSLGLMSGTQQKVFGVDDAERLLKVINANRSADPATNAALTQLAKSVKGAVLGADDSGGVFAGPRQMAAQRFALHDNVPALADAAAGKIAPEDFGQKYLVNGDVDHVKNLVDLLQTKSPAALDVARGQVGDHIQRGAFGENMGGDKSFSPERYAKALRNLGGTEKLNALYGPEITDDLYTVGRVGSYIHSEPAFSPVNRSNTGSAVLDMASEIPVVGKAITALGKKQMIARALAGQLGDTGLLTAPPDQLNSSIISALRSTKPVSQEGN
jgi:hypothetical protein